MWPSCTILLFFNLFLSLLLLTATAPAIVTSSFMKINQLQSKTSSVTITQSMRKDDDRNINIQDNPNACPLVLPATRSEARGPKLSTQTRIIGGSTPDPSLTSHLISFSAKNGHVCSGTIISSQWALTAAHCFIQTGMTARLGGLDTTSGVELTIDTVITHDSYDDRTLAFDISLVRFIDKAPPNTTFIKINSNGFVPNAGAFARNTGYGEQESGSGTLLQVDVPVVEKQICRLAYGLNDLADLKHVSDTRHICAGHLSGGCGACFGDSGGPLAVFNKQGDLVQIGITSFGNSMQCAPILGPTVYTRVSRFVPWMKEKGAIFTEETHVVNVFNEESGKVTSIGFQMGNMNPTQSILLITCILLAIILILGVVFVCIRDCRRKRRERGKENNRTTMEEGQSSSQEETTSWKTASDDSNIPLCVPSSSEQITTPPQAEVGLDENIATSVPQHENRVPQSDTLHQEMNDDNFRPLNIISDNDDPNRFDGLTRIPTAPPLEQIYLPPYYKK